MFAFGVADVCHLPLADGAVDLVFGSPPYCDARTYGIDAQRNCGDWVDWMVLATREALRVSRGAVVWIAGGVTRKRNYQPAVEGLMYEWWRQGGSMYRPCCWVKVGIPGSGGDDWFRSDWEFAVCFKRPGRLPWSDNRAMGHPPKYGVGGELSHRMRDGAKVNQCGARGSHIGRDRHGRPKPIQAPSHEHVTVGGGRRPLPAVANPGNVLRIPVGGGHMGDTRAHKNEACFPERLAEFFVRSLCPPNGIVLDPFSGSGTSVAVAAKCGRRALGFDLRPSQGVAGRERVDGSQAALF